MKKGLVSVTFRQFGCEKITDICKHADLKYVEWGADVHVRAGDTVKAAYVARLCRLNGIIPVGCGSYYNAADDFAGFYPALDTASALGAGYIRIWAGRKAAYDGDAAGNIARAVEEAEKRGLKVSLECHRRTMTEDPELAVRLAVQTGCGLHFQPNPDVSFEANLNALRAFLPYLCAVHVFSWEKDPAGGDLRLPLAAHADRWKLYAETAPDALFLLEFTPDGTEAELYRDAEALAAAAL